MKPSSKPFHISRLIEKEKQRRKAQGVNKPIQKSKVSVQAQKKVQVNKQMSSDILEKGNNKPGFEHMVRRESYRYSHQVISLEMKLSSQSLLTKQRTIRSTTSH